MSRELSAKAYAKVNFGLRVLPKREDGFHAIESIFQTIDLYDELIVTPTDKGCIVQCDSMQLPENNTLCLAYKAFAEIAGKDIPGVNIVLKKGIPSGGGLGGGSSDAAALIRVLEKLTSIILTDEQLDYIASRTGSDVFFFMHCDDEGHGCSIVTGRGEIVKNIVPRTDIYLLLIFPKQRSSTKEAYDLVDESLKNGNEINYPVLSELEGVYNLPVEKWSFVNTFTPVIAKRYEEINKAITDLQNSSCCYAEMSGSGSTVFGVFTSMQQAESVSNLLGNAWNCKLVRTI